MKIVADDKIPFLRGALEPFAEILYLPGAAISPGDVADADALLVRTRTKCRAELLDGSKVKFIASATIGFDHIDAGYCSDRGIFWTNAPGCNSSSVQQYIASALLSLAQRKGFRLRDKTLGVVGAGNVGSKVAKFAKSAGMNVLLNDPPRKRRKTKAGGQTADAGEEDFVSIEEIKAESDIISLHVPLNHSGRDKTWHMADSGFFSDMKNSAFLINSSRGEVVDNSALSDALLHGAVAGCVLDVWENEPNIDLELLRTADLATPHIAGYSADGKANGTSMSVQALSRFFKLGIDQWRPEKVPEPENTEIGISCSDRDQEDILREAVFASYDISSDDACLREQPEDFERLRGDYPLRREGKAYRIKLEGRIETAKDPLRILGFKF